MTPVESAALVKATPPDFNHLHLPCPCARGRDLAVFYKKCFNYSSIYFGNFISFEVLCFFISGLAPLLCILVYRPPRHSNFITEYSELLSIILSKYDRVLILGDFNMHVCYPSYPISNVF